MKIKKILFLLPFFILVSCIKDPENWTVIKQTIYSIYSANTIEISKGIFKTSSNIHNYIEITISDSHYINSDSLYDINGTASGIAIIVFENLYEIDSNLTIDINIIQNLNGSEKHFAFRYPINIVNTAYNCFDQIDSLFHPLLENDYYNAYNKLSPSFKTNYDFNSFKNTFMELESRTGELKQYKIRGFEVISIIVDGSKKELIKFNIVCYGDTPYKMEVFFDTKKSSQIYGFQI